MIGLSTKEENAWQTLDRRRHDVLLLLLLLRCRSPGPRRRSPHIHELTLKKRLMGREIEIGVELRHSEIGIYVHSVIVPPNRRKEETLVDDDTTR
jgi:hypothetical protein